MRDIELRREKARALYSVYKRGLENGSFGSLLEAGSFVASQPAPRFYISGRQASLLIGQIQSRISLINLNESQRRMVWRLWFDYTDYMREHEDERISREGALNVLVERPAPEFYISGDGARKVLREQISQVRRRLGW